MNFTIEQASLVRNFYENLAEDTIEQLFDCLPDVQYFVKNRRGVYIRVNEGYLQNYLMQDQSEIVGLTDYDISASFLADQWHADDVLVLRGNAVRNRMELVGKYDLSIGWFLTNKIPLFDVQGKICGLAGLTRECSDSQILAGPISDLSESIEYIRSHISEPIEMKALADASPLSVSAFERKFKQFFRLTPLQYIKRLRISIACQSLINTDESISAIAQRAGFCDHSYLSKEFLRATGKTPKQFREGYYNRLERVSHRKPRGK